MLPGLDVPLHHTKQVDLIATNRCLKTGIVGVQTYGKVLHVQSEMQFDLLARHQGTSKAHAPSFLIKAEALHNSPWACPPPPPAPRGAA